MREKSIEFGEDPVLAGKWGAPDAFKAVIVFSHPHPLYGGEMSNNVVRLCCHEFNRLNYATLRFDFRGAGLSSGGYDGGVGECRDVSAAVAEAARLSADVEVPLVLAGYSFGAWVNWRSLGAIDGLAAAVLISPPLGEASFEFAPRDGPEPPVSIFIGALDDITPEHVFEKEVSKLGPGLWRSVMDGIDHFWITREKNLAREIDAWLMERLGN